MVSLLLAHSLTTLSPLADGSLRARQPGPEAPADGLPAASPVYTRWTDHVPPCPPDPGRAEPGGSGGTLVRAASLWIGLYQRLLSPADGARCHLYPTCSHYATDVIRKNGFPIGVWRATARLTRNHQDATLPLCQVGGRVYRLDPP